MNLGHNQVEPLGLLELVAEDHRDVNRRNLDSLLHSSPLFLDPLHNLKLGKGNFHSLLQDPRHQHEQHRDDKEDLHPRRRHTASPSCPGTHSARM